jgi:hypothetical protein
LPSLHREYPNKISHVLTSDGDARPPRQLTPMLYGCFDWHSAVHSHWAIARLLIRHGGDSAWSRDARSALAETFTDDKARGELEYLSAPARAGFEMPYGIGWLLLLCAELQAGGDAMAPWYASMQPLWDFAAEQFIAWAEALPMPIRSGDHSQSAFPIGLALDSARAIGDTSLEKRLVKRAVSLYRADTGAPIAWEPSAWDFLSPSLAEADLMARVLDPAEFSFWFDSFLPRVAVRPVSTPNSRDGKLVHLCGLNLSRAWMLRRIGTVIANDRSGALFQMASDHLGAGLPAVNSANYEGAHWLGSYAVYALTAS